jgi:hypothetical protein
LFASECLKEDNLIIRGGELNFTLNRREIWGSSAEVDRLVKFFHNLFNQLCVVDNEPIKLKLTWISNRSRQSVFPRGLIGF